VSTRADPRIVSIWNKVSYRSEIWHITTAEHGLFVLSSFYLLIRSWVIGVSGSSRTGLQWYIRSETSLVLPRRVIAHRPTLPPIDQPTKQTIRYVTNSSEQTKQPFGYKSNGQKSAIWQTSDPAAMDPSQQRQVLFALPFQTTHYPNPNTEDPPYHKEPKPYSLNNKPSTSKHTLPSHKDRRSKDNLSILSSSSEDLVATPPVLNNEWQQCRKTKRKRTQATVHDAPSSPKETSNRNSVLE